MLKRCYLTLTPILLAVPSVARAEDGYDLWLRYRQVADASRLAEYRGSITALVMEGASPTLRAARDELIMGLRGLLGTSIAVEVGPRAGTLIVGTPASSPLVASLGLTPELRATGDEGFVLRSVTVHGARATVIAANRDIGVLYGAFHLLRLIQTNQPLGRLDVVSAPKIQLRMLDHWDNLDRSVERGYAGQSTVGLGGAA